MWEGLQTFEAATDALIILFKLSEGSWPVHLVLIVACFWCLGLSPLTASVAGTSGLSEGTTNDLIDTDSNGDLDLSTSLALSATAEPWLVIDLGTETLVTRLDIAVPEVQCKYTCTYPATDWISIGTHPLSVAGDQPGVRHWLEVWGRIHKTCWAWI